MNVLTEFTRRAAGSALLGGLLLAGVMPVQAAEGGSLRIERNASGSIVQAMVLKNWSFDAARGVLTATSLDGNRRCGYAGGYSSGKTLVLDGQIYAVDSIRTTRRGGEVITVVRPVYTGLFPVCSVPAPDQMVDALNAKGSGSGLSFGVNVLGGPPKKLAVMGNLDYDLFSNPPTISLALAEDVLCLQDGTVGTAPILLLTNTNERPSPPTGLTGFGALDYMPFGVLGVFAGPTLAAAAMGPSVQCVVPPMEAEAAIKDQFSDLCEAADRYFVDGFEEAGGGVGGAGAANVQVGFNLLEHPNTSTGAAARYQIRVVNCSETDATTNLAIKDFYPTNTLTKSPRLGDGSWTCTQGASCSGTGVVNTSIGALAPLGVAVIEVTRPLQAGIAGDILQVTAAAIDLATDSDANPLNNVGSWQFEVRENDAPVVSAAGTCAIDEDAGTVTAVDVLAGGDCGGTGFTISAADTDGTVANVTAVSLDPGLVTVTGDPTFTVDNMTATVTGLSIATQADANGTATLRISATDDSGGVGFFDLDVTVNAVNDPPSIAVLGGFDFDNAPDFFDGPDCTESSELECADQVFPTSISQDGFLAVFASWVQATTKGPANEPEADPVPAIASVTGDSIFFGGASGLPTLIANNDGTWDLSYVLSGSSGTALVEVRVDDLQPANNTSSIFFNITVDNSPPVVTVVDAPDNLMEDATSVLLDNVGGTFKVSATDSEGDPITIAVTSRDASILRNQSIVIDDSDLDDIQITVTPEADAFGMVELVVIASDMNPSAMQVINVTIDNVNDAPAVEFASEAVIEADSNVLDFDPATTTLTLTNALSGSEDVPGFLQVAGDAVLGPFEGSVQSVSSVSLVVTSDPNDILVDVVPPEIDEFGELTFALNPSGVIGTATVEITVTDNGGGNDTSAVQTLNIIAQAPPP